MPASFGIRALFPGSATGLRQFLTTFHLAPPASVRLLAARAAIAARYEQEKGYKGRLGLVLSDARASSPAAFIQSFTGGDIHFQNGQTQIPEILQTSITYAGAHCFGNPKLLGSNSVYLIVSIYPPSNPERAVVFKLPDNTGGGLIQDFEKGQDSTDGVQQIFGGQDQPPVPLVISVMVMGSSLLGDSQKVKNKVVDAVRQGADQVGAAEGQLASPTLLNAFASAFSDILGGVLDGLGLTDQVRGRT